MSLSFAPDLVQRARFAATRAAAWFVNNQVPERAYGSDANAGRYLYDINLAYDAPALSLSWTTGVGIMAVLSTEALTGEAHLVESARRAARYLYSLQKLDPRAPEEAGLIREETPQSDWCYPRDGATAAWALVYLARRTDEDEPLDRARLFARWYLANAFDDRGWPYRMWRIGKGHEPEAERKLGAYQGGSLGFLVDLWRETGDGEVRAAAERIAEIAAGEFFSEDGAENPPRTASTEGAPQEHSPYGEDWLVAGLLAAWRAFGLDACLAAARRYLDYCARTMREDGALLAPRRGEKRPFYSGSAMFLNHVLELDKAGQDASAYAASAARAAELLLSRQETKDPDVRRFGGLYSGVCTREEDDEMYVAARITGYAAITLAKLAAPERVPFYGAGEPA